MTDAAEEVIRRADRAASLLADPLLSEAFEALEADLIQTWRTSPQRDAEARERLYTMVSLLGAVRLHLTAVMENGKVERHRLVEDARLKAALDAQ